MKKDQHTTTRQHLTAILLTMLMLLTAQGAWATIFHFIDLEGNVAFVHNDKENNANTTRTSSVNRTLESPYIDATYYSDAECQTQITSWHPATDLHVYVKYTLKADISSLPDLTGTQAYTMYNNNGYGYVRSSDGNYVKDSSSRNKSTAWGNYYSWYIEAKEVTIDGVTYRDPYNVTIKNKATGKYLVTNSSNTSVQTGPSYYCILPTTTSGATCTLLNRSTYDTSTDPYTYYCVNNVTSKVSLETKTNGTQVPAGDGGCKVYFDEEVTPYSVTYHVRANNWSDYLDASDLTDGDEATYTQEVALGTTIALPSILERYGTTNIQYFDAYDGTAYTSGATLTAAMDTDGDHTINIYVTYDIDSSLADFFSTTSVSYYRQLYFINSSAYHQVYTENGMIKAEQLSSADNLKSTNDRLWRFSGTPYLFKITNKQTGDNLLASTSTTTQSSIISPSSSNAYNTWGLIQNTSSGSSSTDFCFLLNATSEGTRMYFAGQANVGISNNQAFLYQMQQNKTAYSQLVSTERNLTYHIIDLTGKEVTSYTSGDTELRLKDEWRSPFVGTYSYYTSSTYDSSTETYSFSGLTAESEGTAVSSAMSDIYVTYTVSSDYDLTGGADYALHFNTPPNIYQESSDQVETTATAADYPYVCGSGGFFLYRAEKFTKAFADGESTRTRYVWRFYGGDPYRLKIMSPYNNDKKAYHNNATDKYNYFCTYNDTDQGVVTTLTQTDRTGYDPTEYMALGASVSSMTLKTREKIDGAQQTVTALQHMWKSSAEAASIPTQLSQRGVTTHTLEIDVAWQSHYPNSVPHPFQTVEMGTGAFTLEEVEMVPVIHLLDKHGWELAYWPMTNEKISEIKQYNSPMVKQFHWYLGEAKVQSGADIEKVQDFYKFKIKDTVIPVSTAEGSADLTNWTWRTAEYITSSGDNNKNYYVTYDVKDEFAGLTSLSTRPYFMVEQNSKMALSNSDTYAAQTAKTSGSFYEGLTDPELWQLSSNPNIDTECGLPLADRVELTEFDPYALRIKNVDAGTYITLPYETATSPTPQVSGTVSLTAGTTVLSEYSAHGMNRAVTGTTFMYVQDSNGNPRIASRFRENHLLNDYVLSNITTVAVAANSSNAAQQSHLRPVYFIDYHIQDPNNAGTSEYDYTVAIDGESTIAATTLPSGLVRVGCKDYQFFNTDFTHNEITSNNLTTDLTDVYVTYSIADGSGEALEGVLSNGTTANWHQFYFVNDTERHQMLVSAAAAVLVENKGASGEFGTADKYLWSFWGSPYNLKVMNKATGAGYYAATTSTALSSRISMAASNATGVNNTWSIVENTASGATGFCFRLNASPDGYVFSGQGSIEGSNGFLFQMQTNKTVNLIPQAASSVITWIMNINDHVSLTETGFVDPTATALTTEDIPSTLLYRFVDYKMYNDAAMTNEVSGMPTGSTVYVKMNGYNDYAPVVNLPSNTDATTYQYYTVGYTGNSDNLLVNSGAVTKGSGPTVSDRNYHWAMIGTSPLGIKLYNRETGKYLSAASLEANESLTLVDNAADAITWELPYVSTLNAETQNNVIVFKVSGYSLYLAVNSGKLVSAVNTSVLRHIIVPVTVFNPNDTQNPVDQAEYMLSYPGSAGRITTATLDAETNSQYRTHNYKHGFCDYTFYHSYDSSTGTLSSGIPSTGSYAGLPFYGGSEQYPRAFYGIYEVQPRFYVEYLMGWLNNNDKWSFYSNSTVSTVTSGDDTYYCYNLVKQDETAATFPIAKSDQNQVYRWVFSGDPYNLKVHNAKFGTDYYLGAQITGWAVDNALVRITDDKAYGVFNTFEILDDGDNKYQFYLHQGNYDRYTYGLGIHSQSNWYITNILGNYTDFTILPAIDQHALTWKVVDEDGNEEANVSYVNSYVSEGEEITLNDMPSSLIRQYCEYEFLGASTTGTAVDSYTMPTEATTVYVRYKLTSTAPTFYKTLDAYTNTDDKDKKVYQVRMWNWSGSVKNFLWDNSGTLDASTVASVGYVDWALIGSPYNLKFYNKTTNQYINISDFSAIRPGNTIPTGNGTVGGTWEMLVDKTGDLAALRLRDDNGLLYIGLNATIDIEDNVNSAAGADFVCAPGLDGFTFRLKYNDATLRKNTSGHLVAGTTEDITISVYHEVDDEFIDILPARWKRPFCAYTFKYNDTEVTAVTHDMATSQQAVVIDVTYEFDYGKGNSGFYWGKQGNGDTEKAKNVAGEQHGYYMVNNHQTPGAEGNLLFMSNNTDLRVSEAFIPTSHLYTNNYQWTLVGDPYGCKVLCLYDPDNSYTQYLRIKDDGESMEVDHTQDSNDLFELRTSSYANSFWLHPIYGTYLNEEVAENATVHYVGINSMGNHPLLVSASTTAKPSSTSIACYRMEELLDNHMADFVNYRGFVGGLKNDCYDNNKEELNGLLAALKAGTATAEQKARMHVFIDNPENLVQMTEGYYRIVPYVYEHNVDGLGTSRVYVRGYLNGKGEGLATEDETVGENNQKAIRINEAKTAALSDPSTIFYFKGFNDVNGACKISTQGLYLDGNKLYKAEPASNNCYYEDIGGCLVQLRTADDNDGTPRYMSYRQNFMGNESDADRSVNMMYCFQSNGYSRFYLQPIGTEEDNLEPLQLKTNDGGDGYYYSSLYVPYDVTLPEGAEAFAGLRDHTVGTNAWITCYSIEHFYTFSGDENLKRRFVPAGTPVLVRTKSSATCDIMLEQNTPSTEAATTIASKNIFKGTYLARVFTTGDSEYDANGTVYVFGKGNVSSKVGFFKNANKLGGTANNWYLKNNKMYYLDVSGNVSTAKAYALEFAEGGFEDETTGIDQTDATAPADNNVYDLSGRRVERPAKGVYIRNGRKVIVK